MSKGEKIHLDVEQHDVVLAQVDPVEAAKTAARSLFRDWRSRLGAESGSASVRGDYETSVFNDVKVHSPSSGRGEFDCAGEGKDPARYVFDADSGGLRQDGGPGGDRHVDPLSEEYREFMRVLFDIDRAVARETY